MWTLFDQNETSCRFQNVSYDHRVDDPEAYDWCIVPDSGYDGVLFACVAVLAACCLQGKFSALWILLAGCASQAIAFPINTRRWGNSLAIWLGITPADLFLYVFLPPMLVDAAVRISYFHFRKMLLHVISFALLMVLASVFIMLPVLLYVFDLRHQGWYWQHAALFAAMTASTDAVAVGAILKSGGSAPEHLVMVLEGESLFNDATSITLFEIMFDLVKGLGTSPTTGHETGMQLLKIVVDILKLGGGGFLFGIVFGFITRQVLKLIKRSGHKAPEQLALSLGMAYLVFYVAQIAGTSGVIAVVIYGLYGSANSKWNMSSAVTETPAFDTFWDTISFMLNGIVFFYAGASSVNFFWRSSESLYRTEGSWHALVVTFWRLPLIYLAILLVRGLCICLLNPLFRLAGSHMSPGEILFSTVGGLRGAISLILAQMLVTQFEPNPEEKDSQQVQSQIALWTAGTVLLTLLINAPLLPYLIQWTGLAEISSVKGDIRAKAARAVLRYTKTAIHDLRHDEDEMLRGVDWKAVKNETDMTDQLSGLLDQLYSSDSKRKLKTVPKRGLWRIVHWICCCAGVEAMEESQLLQPLLPDAKDEAGPEDDDNATILKDAKDRAEKERVRQRQADELFEGEEGEGPGGPLVDSQGAELTQQADESFEGEGDVGAGPPVDARGSALDRQASDAHLPRLPSRTSSGSKPAKGQVIGKITPRTSLMLERESMGPELPFTRASEEMEDTKADHTVIDMEAGPQPKKVAFDEQAGRRHSEGPRSQSPRREGPKTSDGEGLVATLSPGALRAHDRAPANGGDEITGSSLYHDPGDFLAAASSTASTAFSDASEREPWEPDVLPVDGLEEGPTPPAPPNFRGVLKCDAKTGDQFTVLPQPVLQPKMVKPEEEEEKSLEQPTMRWLTQDLAQYMRPHQQQQQPPSQAAGGNPPGPSSRPKPSAKNSMLRRAMSQNWGQNVPAQETQFLSDNNPEILAEARIRLVSGLKKYFHGKRAEGLLSARGIQVLDFMCDLQMDHAQEPLFMWSLTEKEVSGHFRVRLLSYALFALRRFGISLRRWRPRWLVNVLLRSPNRMLAQAVAAKLSSHMLLSLEVAVEYWLALSWSPQAQWLAGSGASSALQHEVKLQSQQVWKFIINREIEAPSRFKAIQTYRAAMAIFKQQQQFVGQLYSSGMVDESERELILHPIQKKERLLQRRGPHWTTPSISEVLHNLPFMEELPERFFNLVVAKGLLMRYATNEVIWMPPEEAGDDGFVGGGAPCDRNGIFIVIAGLVSRSFKEADGHSEEFLMGTGGVFGLTSALVGESLPGSGPARATGNALAQGPVVFYWPQSVIDEMEQRARADPSGEWNQLRVDLFRIASLFIVDRLRKEVMASAITHYQALALHKARRRALRRLVKKHDPKCPRSQAGHLWTKHKDKEGTRRLVDKEMHGALDSNGKGEVAYDSESDTEEAAGQDKEDGSRWSDAVEGRPTVKESASSRNLLTDQELMACVKPEEIWRKVSKKAAEALARLKEDIRSADLVEVEGNQLFMHRSSVVLLKGTLYTSGRASSMPPAASGSPAAGGSSAAFSRNTSLEMEGALGGSDAGPSGGLGSSEEGRGVQAGPGGRRKWEVTVAYTGPCVLPWLWEDVISDGDVVLRPQAIPFRAGPEGATLVVCLPDREKDWEQSSDSQGQGEGAADAAARLSRASTGQPLAGRQTMQGILDNQTRHRRQKKLGEGEMPEIGEKETTGPSGATQGRGKHLRVLSIKRL